jgi:hypothetical protein
VKQIKIMKLVSPITILALTLVLGLSSCKKKNEEPAPEPIPAPAPTPSYTIPTSYNFSNTNFTTSTQRIAMLGELTGYIRSTHTTTAPTQPTISATKMQNLFINAASQFTDVTLSTSGIQLKDQTSNLFSLITELEASYVEAEAASITSAANPTVSTASSGTKGKLISPARAILVNANGFEYKEQTEKGIMGGLFYSQAMLILNNISTFDNITVTNNITAQEKAWDEAFGYFGVPVTFPTSTVGLKNWGSYCNSVNVAIGSNTTIMNAFLKGRASISNKDNTGRDEAKAVVMATWEKVAGAKCISYLKGAKNNLTDQATMFHNLSEGYGFVQSFRYNPSKTISDADITVLMGYFGSNLYNITVSNMDNAIAKLETVFTLNASLIP